MTKACSIAAVVFGVLLAAGRPLAAEPAADDPLAIFNKRLLPILQAENPSSCTECHLAGVELKNYLLPDQTRTFAALRRDGLIDVDDPEKSKILQFIRRKPEKASPVTEKVRRQELKAFRVWILAAVKDPDLLQATSDAVLGAKLPEEVIRHARKDRVLASFIENIWSERGRCINCHSPERNQRLVKKHGERVSWIVPRDPAATLKQAVKNGIIDLEFPGESLVLTKPLGEVEHAGGPKFPPGSRTDRNFRAFLNDYAKVVNDRYRKKSQVPQPGRFVSALGDQQLRIVNLPAEFEKKLLRAAIYRREGKGWSEVPWAVADSTVAEGRRLWQNMIAVTAPRGSERVKRLDDGTPRLPPGRYLIKIYVDRQNRAKTDRDFEFRDRDFFGEVEFEGEWKPGYQPPKIIEAPKGQIPE